MGESCGRGEGTQMCGKLFVRGSCSGELFGGCGPALLEKLCGESLCGELCGGAIHVAGLLPSCIGYLYGGPPVCVGAVASSSGVLGDPVSSIVSPKDMQVCGHVSGFCKLTCHAKM